MKRMVLVFAIVIAFSTDDAFAQDASGELAELGKKAAKFKTLRLIGDLRETGKDGKTSVLRAMLICYDKTSASARMDDLVLADGGDAGDKVESTLVVGPTVTRWWTNCKTRRTGGGLRETGEQFRLGGKKVLVEQGIFGFITDALNGYAGILGTFDVGKGAEGTAEVSDVVWYSLKPKPGERWGKRDALRVAIAVDPTTGLLAALSSTGRGGTGTWRCVRIETDVALGDVLTVPKQVQEAGIRDFPPPRKKAEN